MKVGALNKAIDMLDTFHKGYFLETDGSYEAIHEASLVLTELHEECGINALVAQALRKRIPSLVPDPDGCRDDFDAGHAALAATTAILLAQRIEASEEPATPTVEELEAMFELGGGDGSGPTS